MEPMIKCILFDVDKVLVSEIVEVDAELGDPNCKLINPCLCKKRESSDEFYFERWLELSNQKELMVRSEDILTMVDPTPEVIEMYLKFVQ